MRDNQAQWSDARWHLLRAEHPLDYLYRDHADMTVALNALTEANIHLSYRRWSPSKPRVSWLDPTLVATRAEHPPGSLRYLRDGEWVVVSPHQPMYSTATMLATEWWDVRNGWWRPIWPDE